MKYATRVNSFLRINKDLKKAIGDIGKIDGIECIDLNYPEHFQTYSVEEVKGFLEVNGLSCNAINLRFRDEFLNGEFGNTQIEVSEKAIELCKEAADVCKAMEGDQIIIWLGFDGFDYSFQIDYVKVWEQVVRAFRQVCDYTQLPVSIEYKPYEERVHCLIDSFGTTMMMVEEVKRDNLGVTLDFCHMLMKKENPAFATAWLLERNKLFNMHLNDGEGSTDDGLMVGTVNLWKTLEVFYYLKKYDFKGAVYFDTFPKREAADSECEANIAMCRRIENMIDTYGLEKIGRIVEKNDAVSVSNMFVAMLNQMAVSPGNALAAEKICV
ncbi:sugar phosphate isomerase/epimerase family protein [Anaerotalea alkaliphila]|uniref:Sugar phosphate isomerase/epimerase n=1 Tax=Anaerotalea alkaliphila TaxID=2662126 RepID=A0A7X5HVC2_9FIRM|nr:sugar phosphate isomerase/epimerase family protein [Anaerotalea alkaliphila]NDL67326.1 sugar phosphate isomerase/epimerase [Anaerotalea alkaliphila]